MLEWGTRRLSRLHQHFVRVMQDSSATSIGTVRTKMEVLDAIELLCDCTGNRGAVSAHGDTAAKRDVAQFLSGLPMDRGVDPSAYGSYAVKLAAGQGRLDVVRYLCELPVDRGVDPSADAVRLAATGGHLDVVRYLCELPVDRGVDPSRVAGMLAEDSESIRVRSCTARYLRSTYCSGLRLWSRSPVEGIRQEALASLARSPLLAIRAMVRQQRAVRL